MVMGRLFTSAPSMCHIVENTGEKAVQSSTPNEKFLLYLQQLMSTCRHRQALACQSVPAGVRRLTINATTATMKYLRLDASGSRPLPFYLAMEEWAATIVGDEDLFFMWQVDPTVIFGRNQVVANEVDVDYCRRHGIAMCRRKSGGGCVYADRFNVMLSYITLGDDVATTFVRYTRAVAQMLCALGVKAEVGGRNDILIDGRKVSGNAFYHLPGRSIVHGTMLYDLDGEHMERAITPSGAKLSSKGVASVRQHVTTLREHLPSLTLDDFLSHARRTLCESERVVTPAEQEDIERLMQPYLNEAFIMGHDPRCNVERTMRFEGVGELKASLEVRHGVVCKADIAGDFFLLTDIDSTIIARLKGCRYDRDALRQALSGLDVAHVIRNMTNEQLIQLLIH